MYRNSNIISVNLDGMLSRTILLSETINRLSPIAIILQDLPKSRNEGLKRIMSQIAPEFRLIHYDNSAQNVEHSDTAILINPDKALITAIHRQSEARQFGGASAIGVSITLNKRQEPEQQPRMILISAYIRPRTSHKDANACLDWIEDTCRRNEGISRTIIMGDFNATNPMWAPIEEEQDNKETSEKHYKLIKENRGRLIERFITRTKLNCLNDSSRGPTYTCGTRTAYIDLVLVGSKALRQWNKLDIKDLAVNKGHKIMIIKTPTKFTSNGDQHNSKKPTRTFKTIHTELLTQEHFIETNTRAREFMHNWKYLPADRIQKRADHLTSILYLGIKLAQTSITTVKSKPRKRRLRIGETNARTRKYLSKLKKVESDLQSHKRRLGARHIRIGTKKLLKERIRKITIKRNRLREAIIHGIQASKINHLTQRNASEMNQEDVLWQTIRNADRILSEKMTDWEEVNANPLKTQQDIEALAEVKFPVKTRARVNFAKTAIDNKELYSIDIDEKEIEAAIRALRKKTYNSPEGINMKTFVRSIEFVKDIVYTIALMSFRAAYIPTPCRTTQGTLIPKKKPGDFRIVHVSSPMAALLELIALKRLEYILETRRINSPYQFGFCALRGRHDVLSRVIELVIKHKHRNGMKASTTIIGLDIKGAFDNVNQDKLIDKLDRELGREPLKYWLAEFLLHRHIRIKIGNLISSKRQIYMGVPQGSALGPILWNYIISDVEKDITTPGKTELLKYADDILIVHNSTTENDTAPQTCLTALENKLKTLELNICPDKSSFIRIARHSQNNQMESNVRVNGQPIRQVKSLCILGVTINDKLKLELTDSKIKESIAKTIKHLRNLRQLELINNAKQWRIAIDSFINSRLIINNWPLLAVDNTTNKQIDKLFLNTLKTILGWPRNTSNKLTRLITNNTDSRIIATRMAQLKQHSDMGNTYKFITLMANQEEATKLKSSPTSRDNIISNMEQNNRFWRRKHYNPNKMLRTFKEDNLEALMERVGPIWALLDRKQGSLMIELFFDQVLQKKIGRHEDYPIAYFNSFATLQKIVSDRSIQNRSLVLYEQNSLIKALENYNNHDWRLIHLRETLFDNGWRIYKIEKETHSDLSAHITDIYRKIATSLTTTLDDIDAWILLMEPPVTGREGAMLQQDQQPEQDDTLKIEAIRHPYLSDYKERNFQKIKNRMHDKLIQQANHTRMTQILCPNTKVWSDITPNWLDGQKVLMLSGMIVSKEGNLIKDEGTNALIHCSCETPSEHNQGVGSTWLDIPVQMINRYTALHRALICPEFEESRRATMRKINRELSSSGANPETILANKRTSQTLLRYLSKCAMNIRDPKGRRG